MIKNDSEIEITYQDVTIKGNIIFKSRRVVGLEIVYPFKGLRIYSPTIPIFAMQYSSYLDEKGNIKEDRKEQLEKLLLNLYLGCKVFDKDKIKLNEIFQKFQKKFLAKLSDTLNADQFSERKKILKQKLRTGLITNIEYQKNLSKLKKELSDYDFTLYTMRDNFLKYIEDTYNIKLDTEVIDQLIKKHL